MHEGQVRGGHQHCVIFAVRTEMKEFEDASVSGWGGGGGGRGWRGPGVGGGVGGDKRGYVE